jgi:uncharacterized protein (TIGR02996 family)
VTTCVEERALTGRLAAIPGDLTARLAYADLLEDQGRTIAAAWLREDGCLPPKVTRIAGNGAGYGYGNGDGYGYGAGNGYGDGDGYGAGYGNGYGDGDGYGYGNGDGYGAGYGAGSKSKLNPATAHEEILMPAPGDYVIVRSRDQGCVCGEYVSHHGREVVLDKARQLFSWAGGRLTLVDFAVVPGECRLSRVSAGEVVMLEACGIIPTAPEVGTFLRAHPGE